MIEAIADIKEELETGVLMIQAGDDVECNDVELDDEDHVSKEDSKKKIIVRLLFLRKH